jgi:hypothetical protein
MSLATYAAPCVRACALRGALLGAGEWRVLAGLDSSGAAIEWMKNHGVCAAGVVDVLSAERSAHEAVIRTASRLGRFAQGSLTELLRCFVRYYDLLNVERLVHRIHALSDETGSSGGRFYDTGPSGLLRPAALEAVTNYPALGRALRHTPFAAPFEAALPRYHEDEDVVRLVEKIEVAFLANWIRAAGSCGLRTRDSAGTSALGVFLVARVIGAAVRLKQHRGAESSRVVEWLSLVAAPARVDACLAILSRADEPDPVQDLVDVLLPGASRPRARSQSFGPRGPWGFLDEVVMHAALQATRGIAFNADFLTAIVVRQMCQAKELTVVLESIEAGLAVPPVPVRGTTG